MQFKSLKTLRYVKQLMEACHHLQPMTQDSVSSKYVMAMSEYEKCSNDSKCACRLQIVKVNINRIVPHKRNSNSIN